MVKKTNLLLVFLAITLASCTSIYSDKSHYEEVDYLLSQGDTEGALTSFQGNKDYLYSYKDRVIFYLEEGMLYRYAGEYEKSNESLTLAENAIEELLTKSISKGILSGVLNDNALDYAGEDYEDIYINIFKALNYLQLDNQEDALVEIRKVNDKLNYLETKYEGNLSEINSDNDVDIPDAEYRFYNDALARYLGVLAYRSSFEIDDSRIEREYLEEAYRLQKSIYNFTEPEIPSITNDQTYLNIFSFTGFGPEKVPETIIASTGYGTIYLGATDDQDTSAFLGFNSIAHSTFSDGLNIKLQFPRLEKRFDEVNYIEVYVDDVFYGSMELVEVLDNIAIETFKLKQPLIVGKTVIRALSKAAVNEISQEIISDQFGEGYGMLSGLIGDVYMQVSENSDLRISRYFPSKIRAMEIPIEPGSYNISLIYYDSFSNEIYRDIFNNYSVKEGNLNLLESGILR